VVGWFGDRAVGGDGVRRPADLRSQRDGAADEERGEGCEARLEREPDEPRGEQR